MKQKKLIINLLLSLLVLILLLSILELAVSVYYNVKYKDILYLSGKKTVIDNQPYSVKSHYIYNTTLNSDGFRDREISIIKKNSNCYSG